MAVNFKNLAVFVTAIVALVAVDGEARLVARADSVTVFHDVNYRGHWVFAPNSSGACHNVGAGDNDKISSIKVGPDTNCVFYAGADKDGVAKSIVKSFKTTGFVYLLNHGLDTEKMDAMFGWACYQVELTILRALALGLNAPEDYFDQYHTAADNQLRLLHYPSVPADELRNKRLGRIGAHSPFCTLTLLLQDEPVPPIPGCLLVNIGDFLMRWSNDTVLSTIHRVRSPMAASSIQDGMARERYSIPYVSVTPTSRRLWTVFQGLGRLIVRGNTNPLQ
ncbi:hypothetical protein ONZ45_g13089 [Pleurotus djamor]|nr:hypothetical protein ONZ45_g13089 [Pleurotus djamor]